MSKISDYYIAQRYSKDELEDKVRDLINSGYVPIGGVFLLKESEFNILYSQALIRHTDNERIEDIVRSKN